MLSPQSIERFRDLYLQEFGVKISHEEAAEQAQRFLNAARVVMQPMPQRFLPRYKELLAEQQNYHVKTSK